MSLLRISLFGGLRIAHDGRPSEVKVTRTLQAMLGYLLLQRHRSHPREVLAGLFWGDYTDERARNCLNTTLWRLRQVLEPEGIPRGAYLRAGSIGEVGFNLESNHWLDVAVFEEQVSGVLAQPVQTLEEAGVRELKNVLQLYSGELLEGLYDDWALRERERLRLMYLSGLEHLMHYYKLCGDYRKSQACGQQILYHDPLREEIHREMMRLYLESGQQAMAVRHYELCRDILAKELGIQPMEETQALYAQIVQLAGHSQRQSTGTWEQHSLQQALHQLHRTTETLDEARKRLQRALQFLERSAKDQDQGKMNVE